MFLPKSDKEFASWISAHPEGFVLNTAANPSATYMVLHKATCPLISPARMGVARGACTQKQYRKVCAEDAPMAHSRSDVGGAILRLPGENERAAVIFFHGGETPDHAAPC
jgi:hypothetical protein